MPLDLADYPSRLIPTFRLVMKFNHLHLYLACGRTTDRPFQVRSDESFHATVAGNPNEVSDATVFAKLIEVGTGKCRIPRAPEFLEPGSVTIDKSRDKIQDAIG
jgi:hypothetical protein